MKRLLDASRCMGQGHGTAICPKRTECQRYTDRSGERLVFSMWKCRGRDFEYRIPVKRRKA